MGRLLLENVEKYYGKQKVVHGINLDVKDGEFIVFVGPSGCGKSTTLRMIAGLEDISSGKISIDNKVVNDLPPRARNISMVFQNYALYPHMTVRENLGFSLKIAKKSNEEIEKSVLEVANILGLEELLDRKPSKLSGGQRQRVAMGRAIVRSPDVFLFDEPLSNLDAKLRTQMRVEIKRLHQRVGSTVIYVTHDQVEAMTLAERIVLMRDGHIEQVGTPLELFHMPNSIFVASFIGSPPMNIVDAVVKGKKLQLEDGLAVPIPEHAEKKVKEGQAVKLGFRADNFTPKGHSVKSDGKQVDFDLSVTLTEPLGTETLLFVKFCGEEVQSKMLNPRNVKVGEKLKFELSLDKCHIFDAETKQAIRD